MITTDVELAFLRDLPANERDVLERDLKPLSLAPGQEDFSRPAGDVLAAGREDASRDTFAVIARIEDVARPVGIGVLQPFPATVDPRLCTQVLLRGFSVDPRWQGRGIGTAATSLAVDAAARRFPAAKLVRLTVHVDNITGQRAYARCGFIRTGDPIPGRAGMEHVMVRATSFPR